MTDNELRKGVRLLKATNAIINYYELAELVGITEKSLYNWLCGCFDLSEKRKQHLNGVINDLAVPL